MGLAKIWYEGNLNLEGNKRTWDELVYYIRGVIKVEEVRYERYAIQTHFIEEGESYHELIRQYVKPLYKEGDILSISEKVIGMCQRQTVEQSSVHVGFWAKFLSHFATKTRSGIGMDEPYKLQLVINMKGIIKVLAASIIGALGKCIGKRGLFYKILGKEVAGIDGFYKHSAFERYHHLAVLSPKDPDKVCEEIEVTFGIPTMIVDANDIDVDILGCSGYLKGREEKLKEMISDNPAGQDDECTPFILIRNIYNEEAEKYIPITGVSVN